MQDFNVLQTLHQKTDCNNQNAGDFAVFILCSLNKFIWIENIVLIN